MTLLNSLDAYYSPPWLAAELAAALPSGLRGVVLDPSVGGGALLTAIGARFGADVQLVGLDVDGTTIAALNASHGEWLLSRANLLNTRSRRASHAWRLACSEVAAVVMNPPFSYRGNGGAIVRFHEFEGRVAPAMQFLLAVLTDLRPTDGVYAVLPDGALDSDKHAALWSVIQSRYGVERLQRFRTTTFKGARVSTWLVRIVSGRSHLESVPPPPPARALAQQSCRCVSLIRGNVPVYRLAEFSGVDNVPFLHTTNLRQGGSELSASSTNAVEAPIAIVNRVGKWRDPECVDLGRVVLSDCLIALQPHIRTQIQPLMADLANAADVFAAAYRGTGAPYITVARVSQLLEHLGWLPRRAYPGQPVAVCSCAAVRQPDSAKADWPLQ
ncbi:hypothetical protein NOZE110980_09275 [Nocardioides zeicaulis]